MAAGLSPDPLGELKRSPRPPGRNKGGLLLRGGEGRGGGRRSGLRLKPPPKKKNPGYVPADEKGFSFFLTHGVLSEIVKSA